MLIFFEYLIVFIIVGLATVFVIRQFYKTFTQSKCSSKPKSTESKKTQITINNEPLK